MHSVVCTHLIKRFAKPAPQKAGLWARLAGGRRSETLTVVDDLNLAFTPGAVTAIVGESGCGKTTLLRLIAGLESPDAGGITVSDASGKPARIGMVFQEPRLFAWLTVAENVALAVRDLPPEEQSRRVRETLTAVGLTDFAEAYPHELSGGMAQRAGFARALAGNPDVLLLDEAFSALDALTRDRLRREFLRILEARPMTVILVTHDVLEAVLLAQDIIKLSAGKVVRRWQCGAPHPRRITDTGPAALAAEITDSFMTRDQP